MLYEIMSANKGAFSLIWSRKLIRDSNLIPRSILFDSSVNPISILDCFVLYEFGPVPLSAWSGWCALALLWGTTLTFDGFCEEVRNAEIESGRLELNLAARDFCPFVPCRIDPPHEIKVVNIFKCTQICSLKDNNLKF